MGDVGAQPYLTLCAAEPRLLGRDGPEEVTTGIHLWGMSSYVGAPVCTQRTPLLAKLPPPYHPSLAVLLLFLGRSSAASAGLDGEELAEPAWCLGEQPSLTVHFSALD